MFTTKPDLVLQKTNITAESVPTRYYIPGFNRYNSSKYMYMHLLYSALVSQRILDLVFVSKIRNNSLNDFPNIQIRTILITTGRTIPIIHPLQKPR